MLMPSIFGENLFDDFFDDFARPMRNMISYRTPTSTTMRTDVRETDSGYELDIDLPGYKREDVKAELKDGYMTISAQKKSENETQDDSKKYLRRERYYGSCSRSFYVGENVTEEDIHARFEDGILKIAVPKKEAVPAINESRQIAIEG